MQNFIQIRQLRVNKGMYSCWITGLFPLSSVLFGASCDNTGENSVWLRNINSNLRPDTIKSLLRVGWPTLHGYCIDEACDLIKASNEISRNSKMNERYTFRSMIAQTYLRWTFDLPTLKQCYQTARTPFMRYVVNEIIKDIKQCDVDFDLPAPAPKDFYKPQPKDTWGFCLDAQMPKCTKDIKKMSAYERNEQKTNEYKWLFYLPESLKEYQPQADKLMENFFSLSRNPMMSGNLVMSIAPFGFLPNFIGQKPAR